MFTTDWVACVAGRPVLPLVRSFCVEDYKAILGGQLNPQPSASVESLPALQAHLLSKGGVWGCMIEHSPKVSGGLPSSWIR